MDVFKTLILDTPTVEGATGTVTSVDLTAGTGISVSGGPITSSGSITVTNTAPDQTVSIASGTGISVTGSYPSFTVTNSSPSLGGDVVGPASATDNAVVRFDSTTGKLIQDSGVSISDANLLTTTALTVNDNTILGSSNTDTVNFNARVSSEFTPATDNTYDLGRTGHEWRDLYINGTANIDSLVADTADVNGGTIDGATIGASTASSGAFTTLSASDDVNFDSGTLFVDASADSVGIGTTSPSKKFVVSDGGAMGVEISPDDGGQGFSRILNYDRTTLQYKPLLIQGEDLRFGAGTTVPERMRITSAGYVGIGTSSPSSKLQVEGAAEAIAATDSGVGTRFFSSSAASAGFVETYTNHPLLFRTNQVERMRIDASGLAVTGAITATGNITAYYSDDRLKTKLGNIENALDKVSKLNGFYYEANETAQALGYKPVREVGLSAQQVEAVLPEVVAPAPIDNEYKTLHYERVIPLLVEAIKELKAEIELLKK